MSGVRGLVTTFAVAALIGLGVSAPAVADEVVGTVTSNDPFPVAVDTETGLAYVGSGWNVDLLVMSAFSNTVLNTISLPGAAWGIAIDSARHTAYVAETNNSRTGDEVFVIDLLAGTVTARIPGFDQPFGLAVDADNDRLYVPSFNGARVTVVDTTTNTVVADIPVGADEHPTSVSLDPGAQRAFVSLQTPDNSVAVIDTGTNALVGRLPIPVVYWTATDPQTHQLYAASHTFGYPIHVVDTQTLADEGTITTDPARPPYGLAVDSANGRLYAGRANEVMIVATADNRILQRIPVGGYTYMVATFPERRMAFATGESTDSTWLIGGPMARVTPDELVFPKGMTQQTGFVLSAGRLPLTVTGLSLTGPDADRFSIDDTNCTHTPIAVGDSCNVMIGVRWTDARPLTASLVVASDDIDGDRVLPLRTVPDPTPTPTPTATPSPTPSPTVASAPVTELVVKARPQRKALRTGRPTTVLRSVSANSPVRVRSTCLLRGRRVSRRVQKQLCQVTTTARRSGRAGVVAPGAVRVRVQPLCSAVRIRVSIRARAEGAVAKTWERTWRAEPTPQVECRLQGRG